jgi:hypothetical protein
LYSDTKDKKLRSNKLEELEGKIEIIMCLGKKVIKKFPNGKYYKGTVINCNDSYLRVKYEDGDSEDMSLKEFQKCEDQDEEDEEDEEEGDDGDQVGGSEEEISDGSKVSLRERYWARAKSAVLTWRKLNGNLEIPYDFIVPTNDSNWPKITWGYHLCRLIDNIKYKGHFSEHIGDLKKWGVLEKDFEIDQESKHKNKSGFRFLDTKQMLLYYKKNVGDLNEMTKEFIVPKEGWPSEFEGAKLGEIMENIKKGKSFFRYKEDILALGIKLEGHKDERGNKSNISDIN